MTTFTIKNSQNKFSKTSFEDAKDLFIFLRQELTPLSLFEVDPADLKASSLEKLKKSAENKAKKLTNFQG